MCQGFGHFSGFLRHFVLAKLAISNIRVKALQRTGAAHCCCHKEGMVVVIPVKSLQVIVVLKWAWHFYMQAHLYVGAHLKRTT